VRGRRERGIEPLVGSNERLKMDVVIAIMQDLDDAKAELEELNECGDLEEP
jgi:hypothetical protein